MSGSTAHTRTVQQVASMQRLTRGETRTRLLSLKKLERFGTWNVHTTPGTGQITTTGTRDAAQQTLYTSSD